MTLDEYKEVQRGFLAGIRSPDDFASGLPELTEMLKATCPISGNGVHNWFVRASFVLLRFPFDRLTVKEVGGILETAALARGRTPKGAEIRDAIDFVRGQLGMWANGSYESEGGRLAGGRLVERDPRLEKEAREYRKNPKQWLAERSAVRGPWRLSTYEVLTRVFGEGARLSFNHDRYTGDVCVLGEKWNRFYGVKRRIPELMVPNCPVRRTSARNPRAIEDFDPDRRKYQVTEFDEGGLDEQASKIIWLIGKTKAKLVMVVWSGKRSLQAWWLVRGWSEKEVMEGLFETAVKIGADRATKTINQLVRTPNAVRKETSKRQSVLYLSLTGTGRMC
jgi:hypothetical protein